MKKGDEMNNWQRVQSWADVTSIVESKVLEEEKV